MDLKIPKETSGGISTEAHTAKNNENEGYAGRVGTSNDITFLYLDYHHHHKLTSFISFTVVMTFTTPA